jgi:hypothetical protein
MSPAPPAVSIPSRWPKPYHRVIDFTDFPVKEVTLWLTGSTILLLNGYATSAFHYAW